MNPQQINNNQEYSATQASDPVAQPESVTRQPLIPFIKNTKTSKSNPNSTQNMLEIAEIRDGIVIMNDGSFRCVLMVKSINFDLMSQQEQEAVEFAYQG